MTSWADSLISSIAGGIDTPPAEPISLIPGVLDCTAHPPTVYSRAPLNAEFRATATLRSVDLEVLVQLPSLAYSVRKPATESAAWPLSGLLEPLGLAGLLDDLEVDDVHLRGDIRSGAFVASVTLATGSEWQPVPDGPIQLALLQVRVEFGAVQGTVGAFASVQAVAAIGSSSMLNLVGTVQLDSPRSWTFAAELSAPGELVAGTDQTKLAALLSDLGWSVELPTGLVGELSMSYDSATGDVVLETAGEFPAGLPLAATFGELVTAVGGAVVPPPSIFDQIAIDQLRLRVAKSSDGYDVAATTSGRLQLDADADAAVTIDFVVTKGSTETTASFGGMLTLDENDPVELALDIERTSSSGVAGSSMVVASYRSDGGARAVDLSRLVPGDLGLPALEVAVEQVVLVWDKDSIGSRYLLTMDLTADSLNAEVPLIGQLFPHPGLGVGVSMAGASRAFSDVSAINTVLARRQRQPLASSGAIGKGLSITGELDLGPRSLALPFASDPDQDPDDPKDNPDSDEIPPGDVTWVPVQRSFGPVHLARAGLAYDEGRFAFLLAASVELEGLRLTFEGLAIETPVEQFEPRLDLAGIGLEYRAGGVAVAGSFLRQDDEFLGSAVVQTKAFSIHALGALGETNGEVSLFVFAALNRPFGGPPALHVTGIAAGFGYNRDFIPPELDEVADHPFLLALQSGPNPTMASDERPDTKMLADLAASVPARLGSHWLAAGVTFESFKMIRSKAVVLVRLGAEVEILLLGLSALTLPRGAGRPYVHAELAIRASVKPAAGQAIVEGRLTDRSYVIDPACAIRGGFAFAIWFGSSKHRGDFVLTLGGYHPAFRRPAHYPAVDRLELSWVNGPVTIGGWAYFALTPACVMAGGQLEASYRDGPASASFTMSAHFLIKWKPFAYDIHVGVSIYAAYTIETIFGSETLDTRISAAVHLWGPEFAGRATITWAVFSFDVEFGAIENGPAEQPVLKWEEFRDTYLPASDQICDLQIVGGLLAVDEENDEWLVDGDGLQLVTSTQVPCSHVYLTDADKNRHRFGNRIGDESLGVQPMGSGVLVSSHVVTLTRGDSKVAVDLHGDRWTNNGLVRQNVAKQLWNSSSYTMTASADMLVHRPAGIDGLRPLAVLSDDNPIIVEIGKDLTQAAGPDKALPLAADHGHPATVLPKPTVPIFEQLADTVADDTGRTPAIARAIELGFLADADVQPVTPQVLADHAEQLLASEPLLGDNTLGGPTTSPTVPVASPPMRPDFQAPPEALRLAIRLLNELTGSGGSTELEPVAGVTHLRLSSNERAESGRTPARLRRTVTPGATAVFELTRSGGGEDVPADAQLPAVRLELDQSAAARVTTLDQAGVVLSDGNRVGNVDLTDEVAVVAIRPNVSTASVVGWHGLSAVAQVAPRTFLVEGGTMITEAGPTPEGDTIEAAEVVRHNRRGTGDHGPGWVRTTLPATVQTIAVHIRRSAGPGSPGLNATCTLLRADGQRVRLLPRHTAAVGAGEVALLYAVPPTSDLSLEVEVTVPGSIGWSLHGVTGRTAPVTEVRRSWSPGLVEQPGTGAPSTAPGIVQLVHRAVA